MSFTLRLLNGPVIRKLAPPEQLLAWVRTAMIATSTGGAELPLRRKFNLPDGRGAIGIMPGYVGALGRAGIKLASLVPPDRRKGSSHLGLMVLYDADGLMPIAVLEAGTITALRTAAASAVATDVLARRNAKTLALLGTGEQADAHVPAMLRVREFERITVWSPSPESRDTFAARHRQQTGLPIEAAGSAAEAAAGADVICATTSALRPFLSAAMTSSGSHVNLVGSSHAEAQEAFPDLIAACRFFVDYRPSAFAQAAELLDAMDRGLVGEDHIAGENGEVLIGKVAGQQSEQQITVYKSLGVASQDIVTAHHVVTRAGHANEGTVVEVAE